MQLEPKAFAVLVYLLAHRDRLVEKDELLDEVWRGTFVTPNALTRVIAQLRKTLGDDAKESRYIETVPTRGYRFIGDAQAVEIKPIFLNEQTDYLSVHRRAAESGAGRSNLSRSIKVSLALLGAAAMLLGWIWWIRGVDEGRAIVQQTRQITTNAGLDLFPAFSPDGSALVYSSLRDGRFELYLRQMTPGGREIQLTSDGGENLQAAWSPDGKQIVYHARRRGGLWVIPALGGLARRLTEFGSRPAWSPDGVSIVFQSDSPVDLSQTAFGALPPATLWIISPAGGEPRPLTQPGKPGGGHGSPAWSPDGKQIVFVNYDLGASSIWIVRPGAEPQLWREGEGLYFDPVFAPDGRSIYFSSASGNFRLWQVQLGADGRAGGPAIELANTGNSLIRHLAVAPDGRRLVYSSLTADSDIGSIMLSPATSQAGGSPVLLTRDTNYRKTAQSFSPDGTTIAYSVWRLGADGEVWLMDADGENKRQLTTEPATVLGWLPGGEVALNQKKHPASPQPNVHLLKVDPRGGQQAPLTSFNLPTKFGRLSPSGKQIAFNRRTGGAINVWKASLDSGAMTQLSFDPEMMGFPVWSPDGNLLAVEMKRGDNRHIAALPSDGGAAQQLTFDPGQSWPGGWSPDGDKIAFAGQRDGVWNVWWVSRSTKRQRRLTSYTAPNCYVRYPAWSPRGDQIVFEYAETRGNIWTMEMK